MIDRKFIGYKFKPTIQTFPRWRISQFAKAIRNTNSIYYDVKEAKNQGYKDLPVPPTFYTSFFYSFDDFYGILGIDKRRLLAGGREFNYFSQCCAGDVISYQVEVESIVEKQGRREKMDIMTVKASGKNKKNGEMIFEEIITLIVFH